MSSIAYPEGQVPEYVSQTPTAAPLTGQPAAPLQNQPVASGLGFSSLGKQPLALNPQLPQVQAAVNPDATYSASQAQLAAEISQRYNDVLKQLGYADPNTGQFVMGRVETDAQRQRAELLRNQQLAIEQATNQRQLEGTLFSGRRGTEQARAEHPFVQSLADLDVNVPQQLSDLYEQAGNIVGDYTLRNNLLLADLANRRAAAAMAAQAAAPPPGSTPPPGTPPPTTPPGTTPVDTGAPTDQQLRDAYARAGYSGDQIDQMVGSFNQNYQPAPYNPLIAYPGRM